MMCDLGIARADLHRSYIMGASKRNLEDEVVVNVHSLGGHHIAGRGLQDEIGLAALPARSQLRRWRRLGETARWRSLVGPAGEDSDLFLGKAKLAGEGHRRWIRQPRGHDAVAGGVR